MKKIIALCICLLVALSATAFAATATGTVTGSTHKKGTERAMQIRSDDALGMGSVSWDVAAPKNSKPKATATNWLISTSVDFSKIPDAAISGWYRENLVPPGAAIYFAASDPEGAYRFEDIPVGTYYLMNLDPFGKPFDEGRIEKETRLELEAKLPHPDEFYLFFVGVKNCLVQKVTVEAGKETHIKLSAVRL